MLAHSNFIADAEGSLKLFGGKLSPNDSFFIVLPLFHAFSFEANFVVPLMCGCSMVFVQSLRTVGQDIHDTKPTVLCAVPRRSFMRRSRTAFGSRRWRSS